MSRVMDLIRQTRLSSSAPGWSESIIHQVCNFCQVGNRNSPNVKHDAKTPKNTWKSSRLYLGTYLAKYFCKNR